MRILVVGAGYTGVHVLRQLQKNPRLTILTLDPRDEPPAVQEGIIDKVDIQEVLTPLTLKNVMEMAQPDLVLLTTATEDMGLGSAPGMDMLTEALRKELAALAEVPLIAVSRTRN